ncbi:MAG TPA: single-stranded-DNA-specific exonuclease RecJ [Blastocatellia bacterium]|nr:single-stranded-DNA-specific exonuclease RecJ [Blastocatellia bacterium]
MRKRWNIAKHDHPAAERLADELGVHRLVAALMIARGHAEPEAARAFLKPSLNQLHEPQLLKGLGEAVERIEAAIRSKEKILIWGDYDVDGTTGTVLLRSVLRILGAETEYHIPDRFSEGYGLNIDALRAAKERGCSLVITVDCGIRSFEPLEWAAENGLDVIVTDHHLSDEERGNPPAVAVVNPNQPGCGYPDKHLAGVGVAFKLAHALLRSVGKEALMPSFLKIAAIGTVADIMQLTGENRAIVALGLQDLPNTRNYGLKALMEVAGCTSEMTSMHIGFRLGPRINAAGRMDLGRHVVELFEAEDFGAARKLAEMLDSRNRDRRSEQQRITELALLRAADQGPDPFVVVAGEGWHRGVIGLAASRIAERLYRPAIVLSTENGTAHGSARSVGDFHILRALESCADLFDQFGGHTAAAGMKLPTANIDSLRRALCDYAESEIAEENRIPELSIDARVSSGSLSIGLVRELSRMEPFGAGNPKPVLATKGLSLRFEPKVMKGRHLKLYLGDREGRRFEAVWWDGIERGKEQTLELGRNIEVAYTLDVNSWQGSERLQLVIEDIRDDN